ncbi:hypothetical protein AMTRI_Chr10g4030 [Amborella trichopoda]
MEEEDIMSVTVIWRGKQITVEINSGSTVEELGQKLQIVTNVKPETMRLLVPRSTNNSSKLLLPFSHEHSKLSLQETAVLKGKSIRMMGVFSDEIEEVSHDSSKPDLRIAGFDEEEKRLRQRTFGRPQSSLRLPQGPYIFCDFRTLSIPGIQLNPLPTEALQRMHMLASDPGIVAIMNKHKWRVGIMTELAPVGYVGVSPKCILGYNKNHGEEISLRLRTDDLKGFRKYESIKKTLLHELAHMVHSEHDTNFYALDKQLNQEAVTLDWTKSKRHTLSGTSSKDDYEWETQIETVHHAPKLGGRNLNPGIHVRESSVAAAYIRLLKNSSDNVSEEPKKQADAMEIDSSNMNSSGFVNMGEPDPDDGDLVKSKKLTLGHEEPDPDDYCFPNSSIMEYKNTSLPDPGGFCDHKISEEPDPDDLCDHRQREDPDPDDLCDHRRREESNPDDLCDHRKREEPDPDDLCDHRTREEPDPDEFSTKKGILKHGSEPDPDDDEIHEEPDPDETNSKVLGNELKTSEPDPDDTGVSEAMAIEPDQDDAQDISEGFKPDPKEHLETQINEPDPDDFEKAVINEPDPDDSENAMASEPDPDDFDKAGTNEPDPDDTEMAGANEPDPDDSDKVGTNEPVRDDSENAETFQAEGMDMDELRRIQDSVTIVTTRLQSSIERLKAEASPFEAASVILTLFKIVRNVIEHPNEIKFKRLRKANPHFQKTVARYKAAMEVLVAIGFCEDVVLDEIGKAEPYLVLRRNDPGLLWLAKSSLELCIA